MLTRSNSTLDPNPPWIIDVRPSCTTGRIYYTVVVDKKCSCANEKCRWKGNKRMIVAATKEIFDDDEGAARRMWNKMIDKLDEQKRKVTIDGIVCCNVDDSLINNKKNFDTNIFKQLIDGLWTNAMEEINKEVNSKQKRSEISSKGAQTKKKKKKKKK